MPGRISNLGHAQHVDGWCDECTSYGCIGEYEFINGEDEEVKPHYHVVEFINGCLNDYDSGPIELLEDARGDLASYIDGDNLFDGNNGWVEAGVDRWERGIHILKIEECTNSECEEELNRVETDFSDLPFLPVELPTGEEYVEPTPFWFGGTTNQEGEVYGG